MSSEAHGPTKRVGFDVMAIKSEHLQICVCPHPLKLMQSQTSWACKTMKVKGYQALNQKRAISPQIGKTTTKINQITDCPISISIDDMVKAKEVEPELARSLSPTSGQTPKAPMKMTKRRLRALHCRQKFYSVEPLPLFPLPGCCSRTIIHLNGGN